MIRTDRLSENCSEVVSLCATLRIEDSLNLILKIFPAIVTYLRSAVSKLPVAPSLRWPALAMSEAVVVPQRQAGTFFLFFVLFFECNRLCV